MPKLHRKLRRKHKGFEPRGNNVAPHRRQCLCHTSTIREGDLWLTKLLSNQRLQPQLNRQGKVARVRKVDVLRAAAPVVRAVRVANASISAARRSASSASRK